MEDVSSNLTQNRPEALTSREQEILRCLSEGLSNQEIANRLYLAEKTIRWYNTQIYSKLGVSSRQEAVERAQVLGLLHADGGNPPLTVKHNLPIQVTPFVGRQRELGELATLLDDANNRLITILAPGGMGKTRLALEAARTQIGRYPDGVYFVPLAPLNNASDIVTTIAESIGFSFYGENPPAQQLSDFLSARSILLVLDNLEHLLDGAPLVGEFVQAGTGVRVLTTTRERLNLRGETVYILRGLEFPAWETPQDALNYEAVKLFMQSAHRVRPDFILQPDELNYMARICRLTAGMPLGIELAAGWVDVLSLEQIAAEIQRGIDILETEMRDVPERQRSVRATFECTWERLNDEEQQVFMRLSVFRGGFTVEAAKVVADADIRSLRKLTNKALVQTSPEGRHDIHELLRQFGADKLMMSSELGMIQARHASYFADFMQARRSEIFTHPQFDALERIQADFENIRTAWNALVDQHAFDELPKFLDGLWLFFDVNTRCQDGVTLFESTIDILRSLPKTDEVEFTLARLLARLAWFYNDVGLSEKGKVTAETAVCRLERYNSPEDLFAAYHSSGLIYNYLGERENLRKTAEKACDLARRLGNRFHEAHSLLFMGVAASMHNQLIDDVLRLIRQARSICEDTGNQWGIMKSYKVETVCRFNAGDYEQTQRVATHYQAHAKTFRNTFAIADSTMFLGLSAMGQGDYRQAGEMLRESLRTFWDAGYTRIALAPIFGIAQLLLHENRAKSAVEILALIERYPAAHISFYGGEPHPYEKLREELKASMDAEHFAVAWARGQQRELSAVVAELLASPDNN